MVVARHRLVFDELFRLQLALVQRKADLERSASGIAHACGRRRRARHLAWWAGSSHRLPVRR